MIGITLGDVARNAEVSKNTVSCALRRSGRVSIQTRERILRIAEEMGYRPNPLVSAHMKSLRRGREGRSQANLAFLHTFRAADDWRKKQYCSELFEGAKRRAETLGFRAAAIDLVAGQLFRNQRGIPDKPKTVLIEGIWHPGRTLRQVA